MREKNALLNTALLALQGEGSHSTYKKYGACHESATVFEIVFRSEAEANAWLAAVMILAALLLMAVIKQLGLAISEIKASQVSQGAMLKQVPPPPPPRPLFLPSPHPPPHAHIFQDLYTKSSQRSSSRSIEVERWPRYERGL